MAGTTGLEPATSAVTGQRSNQLSYVPRLLFNNLVICHIDSSVSKLSLFSLVSTISLSWTQFSAFWDIKWTSSGHQVDTKNRVTTTGLSLSDARNFLMVISHRTRPDQGCRIGKRIRRKPQMYKSANAKSDARRQSRRSQLSELPVSRPSEIEQRVAWPASFEVTATLCRCSDVSRNHGNNMVPILQKLS